jgi:hypothetical protein
VEAIPAREPNKVSSLERSGVADRSAIIIAILWPTNSALVLVRRRTSTVCYRIDRGTAGEQGMRSGRPTLIGKRGVEDASQGRGSIAVGGSGDVGRARSKVLNGVSVGQPAMTEEIEVAAIIKPPALNTSAPPARPVLSEIKVRVKVTVACSLYRPPRLLPVTVVLVIRKC